MDNYNQYFDLAGLIAKYLIDELTPEEKKKLDEWLALDGNNRELFKKLTDEVVVTAQLERFTIADKEEAWQNIKKNIGFSKAINAKFRNIKILPYAAAVFLLFVSALFVNRSFKKRGQQLTNTHTTTISPGSNRAVLTLTNGSKKSLDDSQYGEIARQQNVDIVKTAAGLLIYKLNDMGNTLKPQNSVNPTNAITTLRGGQYRIILSDGTKVWLNAASCLKYPVAFTGGERKVQLVGEAYFEVAKNPSKPFFVQTANQQIRVLGTHFNVNCYPDENVIETTLAEGSISIADKANRSVATLKPGQQSINNLGKINIVRNANVSEALAWKDGKFQFRNTDLATIMRQISRWYDVDVKYQDTVPRGNYTGRISRNVPISQILQILKTSGINFTIYGRTIIVKS